MKNILDLKIEKLNNWTVVNDGSGNEFSSPILSNNNEGVNDIYRTCNFLKANKQKVSGLDGGHIHFDAAFMKDRNAEGAKTAMSLHIIHTIDSFGFKDRLV